MNVLILLSLLLLLPFVLFLAYLALSSCMGDDLRATISAVRLAPRNAFYGRTYARAMGSGAGQAGWEQIEMEDMMRDSFDETDNER